MLVQIEKYKNEEDERVITYYHMTTEETLDAYIMILKMQDDRKIEVFEINEDTFEKLENGFHKKYEDPIKIEIDPENTVTELNDQFQGINNNVAIKTVKIDAGTKDRNIDPSELFDGFSNSYIIVLVVITITVIIIAIFIILWKKQELFKTKGKKEEGESHEFEHLRQETEGKELN